MNESILTAAIEVFNETGPKFTMDDLAAKMRVSKRTLYENITSKEDMIAEIIEEVFADIKLQENEIVSDESLDITEKIKRVVCLMPRIPCAIDFNRVYELQKSYPRLYRRIDEHLTGEWEVTLSLFREGIAEGTLQEVNLSMVRQILLGAMRSLMEGDFLLSNQITYEEAVQSALEIIMSGLITRQR